MSKSEHLNFFVLAGGKGTRFKEVDQNTPKVIARINQKTVIERIYNKASSLPLSRFVLCTGDSSSAVEKYFKSVIPTVLFSREEFPLGTGGALAKAISKFPSEYVLLQNGDTFSDIDYADFFESHIVNKSNVTIAVRNDVNRKNVGGISVDGSGNFSSFVARKDEGTCITNAGIYLFKRDFLAERLPQFDSFSLESDFLSTLKQNDDVSLFYLKENFYDIGTAEGHAESRHYFSKDS